MLKSQNCDFFLYYNFSGFNLKLSMQLKTYKYIIFGYISLDVYSGWDLQII